MKHKPETVKVFSTIIVICMMITPILALSGSVSGQTTRTGAWVDNVNFSVVDPSNAVSSIRDGSIDMYFNGISSTLYDTSLLNDPSLDISTSNGLYYELTLNPAVLTDTDKINPFAVPEIREAMNWLIDRDYINNSIYQGLGYKRFFPIQPYGIEYERYASTVAPLEAAYAYNPTLAETTITTKMLDLGAEKVGGIWHYKSSPVTIILIIRNDSDGTRIPLGDYTADQLESIGFVTDRQYMDSATASSIWLNSNPADGLWHIYTGAWASTVIDRDEGDNFEFYLSPDSAYGFSALWQSYTPSATFQSAMKTLAEMTYGSFTVRDDLFKYCLEESMYFAVRIWVLDGRNFTPRRSTTTLANNVVAGVTTQLWPFTLRFLETEGGDLDIGNTGLFNGSWNPVAGSGWLYDLAPIRGTADYGLLEHPQTGLPLPQRVRNAEVTVITGTSISVTEPWVELIYADEIKVPSDAWAEWDATNQEFIPASVQYPDGATALVRSVVTYPSDLFTTVTWHDGSQLTIGDFIYNMIFPEDISDPSSRIYDENAGPYAYFDNGIVAIKIIDEDPLTIETYHNIMSIDAEYLVKTWWPELIYGPSPWHTTALASVVVANGEAAFSSNKATSIGKPWLNYLSGSSLDIMETYMGYITPDHYIPYEPTLSTYITTVEADERWENLNTWYTTYGHFWVGSGPFFVNTYDWAGKTLTLSRFAEFPDPSDKWENFEEGSLHILCVDYTTGAPGSTFTIYGRNFAPLAVLDILLNWEWVGTVTSDADGTFAFEIFFPAGSEPGLYLVTVNSIPTRGEAASTRVPVENASVYLEIAIEEPVREGQLPEDPIILPILDPLRQYMLPLIQH